MLFSKYIPWKMYTLKSYFCILVDGCVSKKQRQDYFAMTMRDYFWLGLSPQQDPTPTPSALVLSHFDRCIQYWTAFVKKDMAC